MEGPIFEAAGISVANLAISRQIAAVCSVPDGSAGKVRLGR
jgi:hypothetical protein